MSYPQSNPADYVAGGSPYWRFQTLIGESVLSSGGDVYESEVSFNGIAVGPNSDFSRIRITYLDPSNLNLSSRTGSIIITPDRHFAGVITADMSQNYPLAAKKGRLIITLEDLWMPVSKSPNPAEAAIGDDGQHTFVQPLLDVIGYFGPVPSVLPKRSDNVFEFNTFRQPAAAVFKSWQHIPFYGRKYGFLSFQNLSGHAVDLEVWGVNLQPGLNGRQNSKQLLASTPVANNTNITDVIQASVDGMFDDIVIGIHDVSGVALTNCPTSFYVSDDAL